MPCTLRDIAKASGLSINAVSDILNRGKAGLYRPATRELVQATAKQLGYLPNRSAQTMRAQRSRMVGLVSRNTDAERSHLWQHSMHSFVIGLAQGLAGHELQLSIQEVDALHLGQRDGAVGLPAQTFFDALVVHQDNSPEAMALGQELGIPMLWFDTDGRHPEREVWRDDHGATKVAMEALGTLGHEQIALLVNFDEWRGVDTPAMHVSLRQRLAAYREQRTSCGRIPLILPNRDPVEIAALVREHAVTAVLCATQWEFWSAFQAASLLGRAVPTQLSIAGIDIDARRLYGGFVPGGVLYDRYLAGTLVAGMVAAAVADATQPLPSQRLVGDFRHGSTVAPITR